MTRDVLMRSDLYTGSAIGGFSVFMFLTANELPPGMFGTLGAGFFPKIIFGALAVFSFLLVGKSLVSDYQKAKQPQAKPFSLATYSAVILSFILFFLFVVVLKYFGFIIASLFFSPTLMWFLGPKTRKSLIPILLTSVGMTAVIYISFTHVLKVFLPSGTFF